MATNYKVLGQAALTAQTMTDVYTVPAATQTIVSTVVIANRDSSSNTYRVAVVPDGDTLGNEHYISYNVPITGADSTTITIGLTLGAGDVISVYGGASSSLSVSIFGSEIS